MLTKKKNGLLKLGCIFTSLIFIIAGLYTIWVLPIIAILIIWLIDCIALRKKIDKFNSTFDDSGDIINFSSETEEKLSAINEISISENDKKNNNDMEIKSDEKVKRNKFSKEIITSSSEMVESIKTIDENDFSENTVNYGAAINEETAAQEIHNDSYVDEENKTEENNSKNIMSSIMQKAGAYRRSEAGSYLLANIIAVVIGPLRMITDPILTAVTGKTTAEYLQKKMGPQTEKKSSSSSEGFLEKKRKGIYSSYAGIRVLGGVLPKSCSMGELNIKYDVDPPHRTGRI
jgi:hypothetical protein